MSEKNCKHCGGDHEPWECEFDDLAAQSAREEIARLQGRVKELEAQLEKTIPLEDHHKQVIEKVNFVVEGLQQRAEQAETRVQELEAESLYPRVQELEATIEQLGEELEASADDRKTAEAELTRIREALAHNCDQSGCPSVGPHVVGEVPPHPRAVYEERIRALEALLSESEAIVESNREEFETYGYPHKLAAERDALRRWIEDNNPVMDVDGYLRDALAQGEQPAASAEAQEGGE